MASKKTSRTRSKRTTTKRPRKPRATAGTKKKPTPEVSLPALSAELQALGKSIPIPRELLSRPDLALTGAALRQYRAAQALDNNLEDKSPQAVQDAKIRELVEDLGAAHDAGTEGSRVISAALTPEGLARLRGGLGNPASWTTSDRPPATLRVPFGDVRDHLVPKTALASPTGDRPKPRHLEVPLGRSTARAAGSSQPATTGAEDFDRAPAGSSDIEALLSRRLEELHQPGNGHSSDDLGAPRMLTGLSRAPSTPLSPADTIAHHDFFDLKIAWNHAWSDLLSHYQQPDPLITHLIPEAVSPLLWLTLLAHLEAQSGSQDDLLREAAHYRLVDAKLHALKTGQYPQWVSNNLSRIAALVGSTAEYERQDLHRLTTLGQQHRSKLLADSAWNEEVQPLQSLRTHLRFRWQQFLADAQKSAPSNQTLALPASLTDRGYNHKVFAPGTVNYGLMLTYRQRWEALDWQVGELIKTIPLAPKEVRRYKTIVKEHKSRNRKVLEKSLSSRRRETSETSRAESEVIARAREALGFTANASGGVNFGFADIKASTGFKYDTSSESSSTKKEFAEAVAKAADELKVERQVELVEEDSTTLEAEASGEISNPNEEITVTYLFYELQRRYHLSERLHRCESVLLVAQDVDSSAAINADWLLKHDWILRRALLDDSFEQALDLVQGSEEALQLEVDALIDKKDAILDLVEAAKAQLAALDVVTGEHTSNLLATQGAIFQATAAPPDFTSDMIRERQLQALVGQQSFTGAVLDKLSELREEAGNELEKRRSALDRAVDDYNRAIAKQDQVKRKIDRLIEHVRDNLLHYQQAIWAHEPPDQRYLRFFETTVPFFDYPSDEKEVLIEFSDPVASLDSVTPQTPVRVVLPKPDAPVSRRLDEVADINHLLGFKGNYFIFPLRRQSYLTAYLAQSYFGMEETVADPDQQAHVPTMDPDQRRALGEALAGMVSERTAAGDGEMLEHVDSISSIQALDLAQPLLGDLKQAEQEKLRDLLAGLSVGGARASGVSKVTLDWLIEQGLLHGPDFDDEIVVPLNGVYVEALPGKHPVLEPFKLRHRELDVDKVHAEIVAQRLENLRMEVRLLEGKRDDPHVDKTVQVQGIPSVSVGADAE